MAGDQIMHAQPEVLAIDETNNYLNGKLWKLSAGPLFDTPEIGEKLVASMNDELCQLKAIFDIPSKICCNVFSINLKVETNTNETYAEVSLLHDISVQWDEAATISRPDKVSPWEIELLTHSSNISKSDDLKHKSQIEVHEFGSKMWAPTLSQGQEFRQSSIQSSMRLSFPTIYNEQMVQAMKETPTTTATTCCRLFGVDLMVPAITKDPVEPIDSYKFFKISKIFEDERVDHVKAKSRTKVHSEGLIERTVDLTVFDGYNQLIDELERLFDIKGELHMHNQWKMFFIYDDGDMMILGDDPWPSRPRSASAQGVLDPSSNVRDPRAAQARDLFLVHDSIRQLASDDQGVPDQATKDVRDPIEATRSIPARVPFVSSSRLNSFGGPIQQSSKVK
ncbi:hypothetical protein DY000_02014192, partial [Brassica cretica]